jgi:FkbM family methyltransferase
MRTAKQLAASAIARSASSVLARLPQGVYRRVMEALPIGLAFDAVQAAGRKCNVSDLRVMGDYGRIEGSLDDGIILRRYAITGSWRTTEAKFFAELFAAKREGTFIDIGANIGLTTIPIAQNPGVSCKAFEPERRNFEYLRRNISTNCPTADVELFNFALFDKATMLDFELSGVNEGDHRVRLADRNERRNVVQVAGKPLDEVLNPLNLRHPIVVKLSGQGAESQIVMGGRSVLGQATAMAIEIQPFLMQEQKADAEPLLRFCSEQFHAAALFEGREERAPVWQDSAEVVDALRHQLRPGVAGQYTWFRVLFAQKGAVKAI